MKRWFWYFLVGPQLFLVAQWLQDLGSPPLDMAVLMGLFLAFFAERAALPWLLLGAALGRALVDDAGVPVQILVLGVPTALLLPLRAWFFGQRWFWQVLAAAAFALMLPYVAMLCGRWFDQPSASAVIDSWRVFWAALLLPPLLALLRRLPPLAAFEEVA